MPALSLIFTATSKVRHLPRLGINAADVNRRAIRARVDQTATKSKRSHLENAVAPVIKVLEQTTQQAVGAYILSR